MHSRSIHRFTSSAAAAVALALPLFCGAQARIAQRPQPAAPAAAATFGQPSASGLASNMPFPAGMPAVTNPNLTAGNPAAATTITTAPGTTASTTPPTTTVQDVTGAFVQVPTTAVAGGPGVPASRQTTGAGGSGYSAAELAASFLRADINRDGELTRAEFQRLTIAPYSFEEMDTNHDGVVSRFEYDDGVR